MTDEKPGGLLGALQVPVQAMNRHLEKRTERLREKVKQAGGPKHVALLSGVPLSSLTEYLAGRQMRVSVLEQLAHACSVSPSWLAFGEDHPPAELPTPPPKAPGYPPVPFAGLDISMLAGAMKLLDGLHAMYRTRLDFDDQARLLASLYVHLVEMDAKTDDEKEKSLRRLVQSLTGTVQT